MQSHDSGVARSSTSSAGVAAYITPIGSMACVAQRQAVRAAAGTDTSCCLLGGARASAIRRPWRVMLCMPGYRSQRTIVGTLFCELTAVGTGDCHVAVWLSGAVVSVQVALHEHTLAVAAV